MWYEFCSEAVWFAVLGIFRVVTEVLSGAYSVRLGVSEGINAKLALLRSSRDSSRQGASGRDLVPVKQSIIEDDLKKLGLRFTTRSISGPRRGVRDAYEAGREAGERFEYRPGIQEGRAYAEVRNLGNGPPSNG